MNIDVILETRENEHFEIFSTVLLVRTLPYAIIKIKHVFLMGPLGEVET